MTVQYEISGMPEPGSLEHSGEYRLQLVQVVAPDDTSDVLVKLMTVPETDLEANARLAYRQAARLSTTDPANLAIAAALLLACEKLERIDDALRNTVGGSPR